MQYLYKQFVGIKHMTELVWKCFRCNLSFKDDNLAEMHKNISNHSVSKVKSIVA
jgi:hypothetical protein